jgi:hypothetical protein
VTSALSDQLDLAQLMREIERYLAAVDLFRRLGCEPHWRPAPVAADRPR